MKTCGYVLVVLGVMAMIGNLSAGDRPTGAVLLIGLGAYLIHRSNQKKADEEEKDKWVRGDN